MAGELQAAWDRSPTDHTPEDINLIVEKLRASRAAFNAGVSPPRRKAGEPKGKPKVAEDPLEGMDSFEL